MPPAATGQSRTDSGAAADRPNAAATWPPPLLNPDTLAQLPIPLQMMLVSALLPYEVAATSVRLLKNTEALLGELVFHLNTLRPAVSGISQAYAEGQFDQFFRTIGQIQQSTNAVALVWSPLTGLRDRLVPGPPQTVAAQPAGPYGPAGPLPGRGYAARPTVPVRPRSAGYPPPEPVTIPAVPPSTIEYVGRLGGALRDQAASLPGAGWAASLPGGGWLRRDPAPDAHTEPLPVAAAQVALEVADDDPPEPAGTVPALLGLAAPLVPGPVRRLFGG